MREKVMQRMEGNEVLSRQFGVDRFPDNQDSWWPENMRNDFRKARESGVRAMREQKRRQHAG